MTIIQALRPITYGTRRLRPGDTFAAKDSHARLLISVGRARMAAETEPPPAIDGEPQVAAEAQDKPRARRVYRRRDLKAED